MSRNKVSRRDLLRLTASTVAAAYAPGLIRTASAATPVAASPMQGELAACTFFDKQYIFYRGAQSHLCALHWDGRWHSLDLTTSAKAPPILGTPAVHQMGDSLHVFYRTSTNQLAEVYLSADGGPTAAARHWSWRASDLTTSAGVAANVASSPASWVLGSSQHVVYAEASGVIHELYWDGQWRHSVPDPRYSLSTPTMRLYGTELGGGQVILGTNPQQVSVSIYSGGKWAVTGEGLAGTWHTRGNPSLPQEGNARLTSMAATRCGNDLCVGYGVQSNDKGSPSYYLITSRLTLGNLSRRDGQAFPRVHYLGGNGRPGAAPALLGAGGGVKVYATTTEGKIVEYIVPELHERLDPASEKDLQAMRTTEVTTQSGTGARSVSAPVAWMVGNSIHVAYLTADGHIHELTYDSSWRDRDLSALAGA